jgi:hypothetical protein
MATYQSKPNNALVAGGTRRPHTVVLLLLSGLAVAVNAGCQTWDMGKAGKNVNVKNGGVDMSSTCAKLPGNLTKDTEYTFTVKMTNPAHKICFARKPCEVLQGSAPNSSVYSHWVAGCTHDCSNAKGVGSASFTAKCTEAGWAEMKTIIFGCMNNVLGCECSTGMDYSLVYKKVDAITPSASSNNSLVVGLVLGILGFCFCGFCVCALFFQGGESGSV